MVSWAPRLPKVLVLEVVELVVAVPIVKYTIASEPHSSPAATVYVPGPKGLAPLP
jgi:hypothetical protein